MPEIEQLVSTLQDAFTILRQRMMGTMFVYARDQGLSMGQFGAMMHISHTQSCGVSDVGAEMGITNSAASQMLDRLVQLQLISRSEDPTDRRGKLLILTEKGAQVLHEGMLANRKWLEELARSMTPVEQVVVKQAVDILIDKARQLETIPEHVSP